MISPTSDEKSIADWFLFESTDDSSFTMRFIDPETGSASECMHSLRGAFAETDYIYGHAIRRVLQLGLEPRFLSIGLGLGYCETLLSALMLREFYAESFEIDERLRLQFSNWISGKPVIPEFKKVYDQTVKSCFADEWIVKRLLRQIRFREVLAPGTSFDRGFSCILFDAFSSKSSPELWTQEFLEDFFAKACLPECVFATYACTGVLKRALRNSGFDVEVRAGFSSKRDSTFAVRTR